MVLTFMNENDLSLLQIFVYLSKGFNTNYKMILIKYFVIHNCSFFFRFFCETFKIVNSEKTKDIITQPLSRKKCSDDGVIRLPINKYKHIELGENELVEK